MTVEHIELLEKVKPVGAVVQALLFCAVG